MSLPYALQPRITVYIVAALACRYQQIALCWKAMWMSKQHHFINQYWFVLSLSLSLSLSLCLSLSVSLSDSHCISQDLLKRRSVVSLMQWWVAAQQNVTLMVKGHQQQITSDIRVLSSRMQLSNLSNHLAQAYLSVSHWPSVYDRWMYACMLNRLVHVEYWVICYWHCKTRLVFLVGSS